MNTNLTVGKRYECTTKSGRVFVVILRKIANYDHRNPKHTVEDTKHAGFIFGIYDNEVTMKEVR